MNSVLFDGKLEPRYVTVYAGLNSPVFPLFRTPFHKLFTFWNGLSKNKYTTLKQTLIRQEQKQNVHLLKKKVLQIKRTPGTKAMPVFPQWNSINHSSHEKSHKCSYK
jgi:hypothetical protein